MAEQGKGDGMTEREIKNLWGCLQSLKEAGVVNEEQMLQLAERFGL